MTDEQASLRLLTAEVRVVLYGNRQVSLSVYRQLDTVQPDECEPFGRVRDGKGDGLEGDSGSGVFVLGRHVKSGSLVRSKRSAPDRVVILDLTDDPRFERIEDHLSFSGHNLSDLRTELNKMRGTNKILKDQGGARALIRLMSSGDCEIRATCRGLQGTNWEYWPGHENVFEDVVREASEAHAVKLASFKEWVDLPLIVLAG